MVTLQECFYKELQNCFKDIKLDEEDLLVLDILADLWDQQASKARALEKTIFLGILSKHGYVSPTKIDW